MILHVIGLAPGRRFWL